MLTLPLTVDFEGGYATDPRDIVENVRKIIRAGAVGINFEDQIVRGKGLYPITTQVKRIRGIREAAPSGISCPLSQRANGSLFRHRSGDT